MRSRVFLVFFFIVLITAIVGSYYRWEIPLIHLMSKPLIMAMLFLYVLSHTKGFSGIVKWMLLGGILLSLTGDIFLMLDESAITFIGGLAAFLMTHVLYCIIFTKHKIELIEIPFIRRHPWFMFLSGLFAFWMWSKLKPGAQDILLPVTIYITTITVMLILAFNRHNKVGRSSFMWVALGALLFVCSDSFLAWNKFVEHMPHAPVLILGTYGLAQLLIVSGVVEQIREE